MKKDWNYKSELWFLKRLVKTFKYIERHYGKRACGRILRYLTDRFAEKN